MKLHRFVRKARREALSEKADICGLIFSQAKTQHACRLFLNWLLKCRYGCTRRELSQFARDLEAGRLEKGFRYTRASFYRVIRKRLLQLGFLGLAQRSIDHGWAYKHVLIHQPIPKRGPDAWSFARLCWLLCNRWNEQLKRGQPT